MRFLASKLAKKSKYDTKVFCCINSIWVSKNAFDADCESFEIIAEKSFIHKNYMRNTFAYSDKSKKLIFSNTFYNVFHIFGNFSTDSKSASNQILLFCYPYWIDETQNVLILALFTNFEAKTARNGSKQKKRLLKCVLEFNDTFTGVLLNFFKKVKITALYYCTRLRKNLRNFVNATQEWWNM